MIDILKKYVDTGIALPEYQVDKLLNNKSLLTTYFRKRIIGVMEMEGDLKYYELNIIGVGIKNNMFKPEMLKLFVEADKNIELFINPPSEQEQLDLVERHGYLIRYIDNPSEPVQIAAVEENGYSIKNIIQKGIDPSENVQIAAVKQDGYAIMYISKPSERVQLSAVRKNGSAIQYIKNPSEDVQLAAVKETVYAIMYIDKPYPSVIEYLKNKNQ
jgi:hypothetical protein